MRKQRSIPGRYRTFGRFMRNILRVNKYRFDREEAERIARLSYWRSIGQPWLG